MLALSSPVSPRRTTINIVWRFLGRRSTAHRDGHAPVPDGVARDCRPSRDHRKRGGEPTALGRGRDAAPPSLGSLRRIGCMLRHATRVCRSLSPLPGRPATGDPGADIRRGAARFRRSRRAGARPPRGMLATSRPVEEATGNDPARRGLVRADAARPWPRWRGSLLRPPNVGVGIDLGTASPITPPTGGEVGDLRHLTAAMRSGTARRMRAHSGAAWAGRRRGCMLPARKRTASIGVRTSPKARRRGRRENRFQPEHRKTTGSGMAVCVAPQSRATGDQCQPTI